MTSHHNSAVPEVSAAKWGDTLSKASMTHLALNPPKLSPKVTMLLHHTLHWAESSTEAELEMYVIHNTDSI